MVRRCVKIRGPPGRTGHARYLGLQWVIVLLSGRIDNDEELGGLRSRGRNVALASVLDAVNPSNCYDAEYQCLSPGTAQM